MKEIIIKKLKKMVSLCGAVIDVVIVLGSFLISGLLIVTISAFITSGVLLYINMHKEPTHIEKAKEKARNTAIYIKPSEYVKFDVSAELFDSMIDKRTKFKIFIYKIKTDQKTFFIATSQNGYITTYPVKY